MTLKTPWSYEPVTGRLRAADGRALAYLGSAARSPEDIGAQRIGNLLAAAPELAEVLRALLLCWDILGVPPGLRDAARAALAKAGVAP